jgi:hypothetical protein
LQHKYAQEREQNILFNTSSIYTKTKKKQFASVPWWSSSQKCMKSSSSNGRTLIIMGENGTDIFQLYSRPNLFKAVQIRPYPSPDIQYPKPHPYLNTQITYL